MSERTFPVIGYGRVPRHLAEQAYRVYAARWGGYQSLDELERRGGFHAVEFTDYLFNRHNDNGENEREKQVRAVQEIAAVVERCSPQRVERLEKIGQAARGLLLCGYEFDWEAPGFGEERIDPLHEALNTLPDFRLPD